MSSEDRPKFSKSARHQSVILYLASHPRSTLEEIARGTRLHKPTALSAIEKIVATDMASEVLTPGIGRVFSLNVAGCKEADLIKAAILDTREVRDAPYE